MCIEGQELLKNRFRMYEKPTSPILKKEGGCCPLVNYFFFPMQKEKKKEN